MILLIFIWHLDHDNVLDYFKDYNFWIMDIFIYYFYCYYTAWNEDFFPCFQWWRGGFLLADSFHRFSAEKPGELHEILVCGGSPHGEIGWRSLCFRLCLFICLFITCLFITCLYVCFLITLRKLFVASCISYVV